ncbi:O-antigen ligase family protein [Desulfobulbus sp. TB]|nr:O-antigen ligase family protein [Desulfobulbus sp. TB]
MTPHLTLHTEIKKDTLDIKGQGQRQSQRDEKKEGKAFFLFLFTLFFAPLAFGTTETWSILTVELLIALTGLFLFVFQSFSHKRQACYPYYQTPGMLPLLLLLAWMFLQVIPLPIFLVRTLSPATFHAYQPILGISGAVSPDHWIPLTVHRNATLFEALRVSSCVLFYLLTVQLLTSYKRFMVTVKAISGLALCIAVLAILQRMSAPDTLFWFRQLTEGKTAFGPWVYRNHYAGFMVLLCPLVLAQFLLYRPSLDHLETVREKILSFFSAKGATAHLLMGFGTVILLASVFLTQSRGGILSIICSLLFFFLLIFQRKGRVEKLPLMLMITGLLVIVGWYSWEPIWERFHDIINRETGEIKDDRLLIWADSLRIIKDFPITGTGFGTFVDIFPSYKTIPDNLLYEHAHNDLIELLTDGGVPACIFGLWFMISILKTGYRQIFLRRDNVAVLLSIGAFSGLVGLLIFSLFDFNLHNGANSLYFAMLCGLLVSASHTRQYYQGSPTLLIPCASSQKVRSLTVLGTVMGVLLFLCLTLFFQGKRVIAERYYQQARLVVSQSGVDFSVKREKLVNLLEKARKFDPLTGLYAYALANVYKIGSRQGQNKKALALSAQAVLQEPMHFSYLQQLGRLLVPALTNSDSVQAQQLMETGYRRGQQKDLSFQGWAEFELSRPTRQQGLVRLHKEFEDNTVRQTGQSERPRRFQRFQTSQLLSILYPLLIKYKLTEQEMLTVLPATTSAWFAFWQQLTKEEKAKQYAFVLERSLDFIGNEPQIHSRYFVEAARYYRTNNKKKKEEDVLLLGIQYVSGYAPFHIQLGEIYLRRGEQRKAVTRFMQALQLDPENKGVRDKIKKIQGMSNNL